LLLLRDLIIFVVLYPRDKFKKSLVGIENDTLPMELVVDLRNKYKLKIRLESLESNAFIFKDSPFDAYNHISRINSCGSPVQNEKKPG
jgi:hypothetical protein